MSVKQLIDKWESENGKLYPQTIVKSMVLKASIMAYQTRLNCINDLKEYQKEQLQSQLLSMIFATIYSMKYVLISNHLTKE